MLCLGTSHGNVHVSHRPLVKTGVPWFPEPSKGVVILDAAGHVLGRYNVREERSWAEETPQAEEFEIHKVECPHTNKSNWEGIIPFLPSEGKTQCIEAVVVQHHIEKDNAKQSPSSLLPFDRGGITTNRINELWHKTIERNDRSCNKERRKQRIRSKLPEAEVFPR